MAASIFGDKSVVPADGLLAEALGARKALWDKILEIAALEAGDILCDWKFYTKDSGWTLAVRKKKRNLTHLSPQIEAIQAVFIFGEKAVTAAMSGDLPEEVKQSLRDAKPYMEGRGIRYFIRTADDLNTFQKLIAIKLAN